MRLYGGKVSVISAEVVRTLTASGDIETSTPKEVEADITAVLENYLSVERDVAARAKEILEQTGRPTSDLGRIRTLVADEKGIRLGEDTLDFLLDQVVAMFAHSHNVEEIFADDVELRRKMAPIFKRHMSADASLDAEVRSQLKHLREGSREWEFEYGRAMDQARRRKGL